MNKTLSVFIGIVAVAALVLGGVNFYQANPPAHLITGGRGGIGPSQYQAWNFLGGLFAGSTGQWNVDASGNVTTQGSISAGGTGSTNKISVIGNATTSVSAFLLGPVTSATSSQVFTVSLNVAGLAVGDPCTAGYNYAPTSSIGFSVDANVTAASANVATATAVIWNASSSPTGFPAGILRTLCFHPAI